MTPAPDHDLARRLLMREAGGSDETAAMLAAAERVLERLREHLARWFGPDGIDALVNRALSHARRDHPALADVRLVHDGEQLRMGPTDGGSARDPVEMAEALAALIAACIALLERLVGGDMVERLLHQLWPDELRKEPMPGSLRSASIEHESTRKSMRATNSE